MSRWQFYSVQRDVSGAIQQARSLEVAERFLALTGDAIAMLDNNGVVLRTNQAFDALFNVGVTPERTRLADVALSVGADSLLDAFGWLDEENPSTSIDVSTEGKAILANGFNWLRYRLLFENGAEVGDLDHRNLEPIGLAKRLAKLAAKANR